MKVPLTPKTQYNIALLTSAIAAAAFLLCACACIMSPVSWSPDSKKIALLVSMDDKDPNRYAIFTYDLKSREHTLIDKSDNMHVLSAPSWSPDGKWIAYYKTAPTQNGKDLFSEDNDYLAPFRPTVEPYLAEIDTSETFDVQLIIASTNGRTHKVLTTFKSCGDLEDDDYRTVLFFMKPVWSENSKTVFYTRILKSDDNNGLFYVASVDVKKRSTAAHLFCTDAVPVVSPDSKMLAASFAYEDKKTDLILADINGKHHKTYTLDIERNVTISSLIPYEWTPRSRSLIVQAEEVMLLLDIETGNTRILPNPASDKRSYFKLSPRADRLYYLAIVDDPNDSKTIYFKSMKLTGDDVRTEFELSYFPVDNGGGFLSISPDCKTVLARTIGEDEDGDDSAILVLWDGKEIKHVPTTPWLMEAFQQKSP